MMRRSPTAEAAVGRAMAARGTEVAYIDSAASSNFITAALVRKSTPTSWTQMAFEAASQRSRDRRAEPARLPNLREPCFQPLTQDGYALCRGNALERHDPRKLLQGESPVEIYTTTIHSIDDIFMLLIV